MISSAEGFFRGIDYLLHLASRSHSSWTDLKGAGHRQTARCKRCVLAGIRDRLWSAVGEASDATGSRLCARQSAPA
jgi:hypothetical protein